MAKSIIDVASLNRLAQNMKALDLWCNQQTADLVTLPNGSGIIPLYKIAQVANDIDDGNIPYSAINGLSTFINSEIVAGNILPSIVVRVANTSALTNLTAWDGRVVLVDGYGGYQYSTATKKWTSLMLAGSAVSSGINKQDQTTFNQWVVNNKADSSSVYSKNDIDTKLSNYVQSNTNAAALKLINDAISNLSTNKVDNANFTNYQTAVTNALKGKADNASLNLKQDVINAAQTLNPVSSWDQGLTGVSHSGINTALQGLVNRTEYLSKNKLTKVDTRKDLDSLSNPIDGQVVYVGQYTSDTNLGGGVYIYRKTSGWVKSKEAKLYTNFDFGLTGDPTVDGECSDKMQAMLNALPDYSELRLIGTFTISKNIIINTQNNITLVGGVIKGIRDAWTFNGAFGLLKFDRCLGTIKVKGIRVIGVNKNMFGDFQAGDAGLQFFNCGNVKVEDVECSDHYAWGILNETSNISVKGSYIHDCTHQSGISLNHSSTEFSVCKDNVVLRCGLYGIEIEDQTVTTTTKKVVCQSNFVANCTYGITVTGGGVVCGTIADNWLIDNTYGIWVINVPNGLNVTIQNNNFLSNWKSVLVDLGKNVKVINNHIDGKVLKDTYYNVAADSLILAILDSNNFVMKKGFVNKPGIIYVAGKPFNVTAVNDYVDPTNAFQKDNSATIQLSKITVDTTITTAQIFSFVQMFLPINSWSEAVVTVAGGCDGALVKGNYISGGQHLFFTNAAANVTVTADYIITGNTFGSYGTYLIYHLTETTYIRYSDNTYLKSEWNSLSVPDSIIFDGYLRTKSVKYIQTGGKTANGPVAVNFSHHKKEAIVGFMVGCLNPTTTGNLMVKLSGTDIYVQKPDNGGTLSGGAFIRYNAYIYKGVGNLNVHDTVGDLKFDACFIDVLVID